MQKPEYRSGVTTPSADCREWNVAQVDPPRVAGALPTPGIGVVSGQLAPGRRGRRAARPRWRWRDAALALAVGAYLGVQILVPAAGLVQRGGFLLVGSDLTRSDRTQIPFSWQMFSVVSTSADYEVRWSDGSVTTVNSVRELGRIHGRAHYASVPQRLCTRLPGAVLVRRQGVVHEC